VGKSYESGLTFEDWQSLLREVIAAHFPIIRPRGLFVVNIAAILCFKDPATPKVQGEAATRRRSAVTRQDVERAMREHPSLNRYQIAALLGCSEQKVDRRLNGNNIRGGKYDTQTRIKIAGGMLEDWALKGDFSL
jgi:site-specific DNA-methyltransferase (adenine-specific)